MRYPVLLILLAAASASAVADEPGANTIVEQEESEPCAVPYVASPTDAPDDVVYIASVQIAGAVAYQSGLRTGAYVYPENCVSKVIDSDEGSGDDGGSDSGSDSGTGSDAPGDGTESGNAPSGSEDGSGGDVDKQGSSGSEPDRIAILPDDEWVIPDPVN